MRKVVTANVIEASEGSMDKNLVVICDDGSVWDFDWRGACWVSWPPIPGTPAADVTSSDSN